MRVLWNSRVGMQAQQEKMDVVSNNISNMETNGYKKLESSFKDLLYEKIGVVGVPTSSSEEGKGALKGTGVKLGEISRNFEQGNLMGTNISTDFAIDGKGFFKVTTPKGEVAYKRGGKFSLDSLGNLSDDKGNILYIDNKDQNLKIDSSFKLDEQGNIFLPNNGEKSIGKINVYDFTNKGNMVSFGDDLFTNNNDTETVSSDYSIKQGFLEISNVDISKEMTDLIMAQRAFELNSRGLKTADEMMNIANNLRGR